MKSSSPFFSIIIPALNEEVCLPILLKSLSKQSFKDFEVIVVDGNSKDSTVKKAKSFVDHVPSLKIISSKIRNVSYQRNLGAKNSIGKYLIFSDADNQFPVNFFNQLTGSLHRSPQHFFTTWFLPQTNQLIDIIFCFVWNLIIESKKNTSRPLAIGAFIGCTPTSFSKIGGFDTVFRYGEDKRFSEDARLKGFKLFIFSNPKFIMSLRRIKREGIIKSISNYINLNNQYYSNKSINQEKDYPMGGDI